MLALSQNSIAWSRTTNLGSRLKRSCQNTTCEGKSYFYNYISDAFFHFAEACFSFLLIHLKKKMCTMWKYRILLMLCAVLNVTPMCCRAPDFIFLLVFYHGKRSVSVVWIHRPSTHWEPPRANKWGANIDLSFLLNIPMARMPEYVNIVNTVLQFYYYTHPHTNMQMSLQIKLCLIHKVKKTR